LAMQHGAPVEREQARELLRILMLQKEERNVQEKKDVDGPEVLAPRAEHGSANAGGDGKMPPLTGRSRCPFPRSAVPARWPGDAWPLPRRRAREHTSPSRSAGSSGRGPPCTAARSTTRVRCAAGRRSRSCPGG